MRHTLLAADLRRDDTTPKQVSRSQATLFHGFEITPRPRLSPRRTR
jgi:hypothetical protein